MFAFIDTTCGRHERGATEHRHGFQPAPVRPRRPPSRKALSYGRVAGARAPEIERVVRLWSSPRTSPSRQSDLAFDLDEL